MPRPRLGPIILPLLLAASVSCTGQTSDEAGVGNEAQGAASTDPVVERAALTSLLNDFLANTDLGSVHDRFWADDLVYTSSNGTRRGKSEIMAGFQPSGDAPDDAEEVGPTYSAEDVDIRVYGATAVVAFRLVIAPPAGSAEAPSFNWNTGTFLKRDGEWRAVAWQSTRGAGRP